MLPSIEDKIEQAASDFRAWAKHENQTNPDVFTWVQKLKHEKIIADYRRASDDEMPNDEGEYDSISRILSIPERVFRAASDFASDRDAQHRRARFSFAHEVAHVWLNHSGVRYRNTSARPIEKFQARRRVDERHANRFAGAILIGRNLVNISQPITSSELAQRFTVSEKVAAIRLEELHTLRRRALGILRPLPPGSEEAIQRLKDQNKRR